MNCTKCYQPIEQDRIDRFAKFNKQPKFCEKCNKKAQKARMRKEKDELMKSLGLTKVRGTVSGKIYWE